MCANVVGHPAQVSKTERLEAELKSLTELDLSGLRQRWSQIVGRPAPARMSRGLLHRVLAYHLQAVELGELDFEIARALDRVAVGADVAIASPEWRDVKPGTLLVREWGGMLHRVMVLEHGFAWNGQTYISLSKVAREITGTAWNGPRFFGLRDARKWFLGRGPGRSQRQRR